MKRVGIICIALLLLVCLTACGAKEYVVGAFSYAEDCAGIYEIPNNDYVNTVPQEIQDVEQVVKLAKKEVSITYNTIDVAYDETAEMWRVCFWREGLFAPDFGGGQNVYLDKNGITQMVVSGK